MLEIKKICYILNIISNLLSTELLEEQKFDFNLIFKTDSEKQFKITNTENWIFHAIKTSFNVYKIAAVKNKFKEKFKEKFKNKSTIIAEEDNKLKIFRSIYN